MVLCCLAWVGCGPSSPSPAELEFQRGQNALAEQRFDWARRHFAAAHELDPSQLDALKQAGMAWLRGSTQALEPAVDHLQSYLEHRPDDADARFQLARCRFQLGEHEVALALLEGLDPGDPSLGGVRSHDVTLLRGQLLLASKPEEVLRASEPLLDDPEVGHLALDLASQAQAALGDLPGAVDLAERSLEKHPLQDSVHYRLSRLYLRLGRMESAQDAVQRSQQIRDLLAPDGATPTERLRDLKSLRPPVDPDNRWVLQLASPWWLAAGEPEDVQRVLEGLRRAEALTPIQQWDGALALLMLEHRDDGEALLLETRHAYGDHPVIRQRWVTRLLSSGELEEARQMIDQDLQQAGHLGRHYYHRAQLELAEGKPDAARDAFEEALHRAPWMAPWRHQLIRILLQGDQKEAAYDVLEAAPESHLALDGLRRLHWPETVRGDAASKGAP